MQVTSTTTAVKGTLPLNVDASHSAAPDQDFLSAISAAYVLTDTPSTPVAPVTEQGPTTAEEVSPVAQYQAVTGRTVAESDPDLVIQDWWCEETLAHMIANQFTGNYLYPIDTSKTIDWYSRGDHQLTAEEIEHLKEKYNIDDLSPQEYYDLMSDLTHMGVLSGEEVVSPYIATVGSLLSGQAVLGGMRETGSIFSGGRATVQGTYQGSVLRYFTDVVSSMLESLDWLGSGAYSFPSEEKQELFYNATLQTLQPRQKLLDILTQLR